MPRHLSALVRNQDGRNGQHGRIAARFRIVDADLESEDAAVVALDFRTVFSGEKPGEDVHVVHEIDVQVARNNFPGFAEHGRKRLVRSHGLGCRIGSGFQHPFGAADTHLHRMACGVLEVDNQGLDAFAQFFGGLLLDLGEVVALDVVVGAAQAVDRFLLAGYGKETVIL